MKTKTERQAYQKAGPRPETLAVLWLRLKGYIILERRYKTRQGEIDIIAKKGVHYYHGRSQTALLMLKICMKALVIRTRSA